MGCPRQVHHPCVFELGEVFLCILIVRVLFRNLKECVIGQENYVVGGHATMSLSIEVFFSTSVVVPSQAFHASLMVQWFKNRLTMTLDCARLTTLPCL